MEFEGEIPLGLFPLPAPVRGERHGYIRTEGAVERFWVPPETPAMLNVSAPEHTKAWACRMTDHKARTLTRKRRDSAGPIV